MKPKSHTQEANEFPTEVDDPGAELTECADTPIMPLLSLFTDHDDLCFWRMSLRDTTLHFPENARHFFCFGEDVLPTNVDDWIDRLVLAADKQLVRERIGRAVTGDSYVPRFSFRIQVSDGAVRWIEQRGAVHQDDANREMIWLSQDITDRLKTADALHASQDTLHDILARAGVGMVILDSSGRFIFCNPAFCSMLGYEAHELVGQPMSKLTLPEMDAVNRQQIQNLVKRQATAFRLECQLRTKFGSTHWVEKNVWLLPGAPESPPQLFAVVVSIEALRQSMTRLSHEHEKLQAIFDNADVGLALADRSGQIIAMNRAALNIHGLRDWDEALASIADPDAYFMLQYPDGRKLPRDQWPSARTARGEYMTETYLVLTRKKTGQSRYVKYTSAPVRDVSGDAILTLYSLNDLTETQRLHEQLAQSQRLEALGRLAGGVAHDFNNVLSVIAGNLELIADSIHDDRTPNRIAAALAAAETGASINRRLLTIARKRLPMREKVDITGRVQSMVELLERVIGSNIKLQISLPKERMMTELDPGEFDAAFLNLVTNGRDAMPDGGELFISVGRYGSAKNKRRQPSEKNIVLTVRDTGAGMSPETLRLAAEPFFTTKDHGNGVGLGLTGVYAFANEYDGYVEIDSSVGQGTEVRLYLPEANHTDEESDVSSKELPRGEGQLILVVEDNDAVRDMACQRILKLGYNIQEARSGDEAWDRIQRGLKPDCIFSDIEMPGDLDGIELSRRLEATMPQTPVVLCTGHHEMKLSEEADGLEKGRTILSKPYSLAQLATTLHEALSASRSLTKT